MRVFIKGEFIHAAGSLLLFGLCEFYQTAKPFQSKVTLKQLVIKCKEKMSIKSIFISLFLNH